jgi:hypothetical protein
MKMGLAWSRFAHAIEKWKVEILVEDHALDEDRLKRKDSFY